MDCDSFYQQGQDWRRRRWGWGEKEVRGPSKVYSVQDLESRGVFKWIYGCATQEKDESWGYKFGRGQLIVVVRNLKLDKIIEIRRGCRLNAGSRIGA